MNDFTVFLYFIAFAVISGASFAFMWKTTTASIEALNKPKTKVPAPHPEMEGVKWGEELMIFKMQETDDDDGDSIISR